MADALTDLNQMIERIRREALEEGHAAGYALAMAKVAAFTMDETVAYGAVLTAVPDRQETARAPRGQNRELVLGALAGLGVSSTVKEIQAYLDGRGQSIPYSSIQAALVQLSRDGAVISIIGGKWLRKTNTTPSEQTEGVA